MTPLSPLGSKIRIYTGEGWESCMSVTAVLGPVAKQNSCCYFPKLNKLAAAQTDSRVTAGCSHRGWATQVQILTGQTGHI